MKTNPKNRLARQLRKIKEDKQEKEGVEETEVEKMETAKAAKSTEKVTPVLTNKAIKKLELKKRNQKKKKMAGRLRFGIAM